jgi:hypothetical protein
VVLGKSLTVPQGMENMGIQKLTHEPGTGGSSL